MVLTVSVALLGVSGGAITAAVTEQPDGVTADRSGPDGELWPRTRQAAVAAWRAELAERGARLPSGWQELSTDEIRYRYLAARRLNDGPTDPEDLDPGMMRRDPCGSWTQVVKPECW